MSSSSPILAKQLIVLRDEKKTFLSSIAGWPLEKLSYRLSSGEWSALQILDHLVKTETAIISAARTGLDKPRHIGMTDSLRTAFLQKVFASDRQVKVPSSASVVLPGSDLELGPICDRWEQSHAQIASLVEGVDAERLSQGIFKHPVGGWMGLPQILEFFSIHIVHHRFQLERISSSFSGNQT